MSTCCMSEFEFLENYAALEAVCWCYSSHDYTQINVEVYVCLERDSNQRSQCSSALYRAATEAGIGNLLT
jgi:hypothetical protein